MWSRCRHKYWRLPKSQFEGQSQGWWDLPSARRQWQGCHVSIAMWHRPQRQRAVAHCTMSFRLGDLMFHDVCDQGTRTATVHRVVRQRHWITSQLMPGRAATRIDCFANRLTILIIREPRQWYQSTCRVWLPISVYSDLRSRWNYCRMEL